MYKGPGGKYTPQDIPILKCTRLTRPGYVIYIIILVKSKTEAKAENILKDLLPRSSPVARAFVFSLGKERALISLSRLRNTKC